MITRRESIVLCAGALAGLAEEKKPGQKEAVTLLPVPENGIQPQAAVDTDGTIHLIYYSGEAHAGDIFYTRSTDLGRTFAGAIRVNNQPGSAIAAGTIRGAQIALGRGGRPHVAWNGSQRAEPVGPVNPDSGKPGAPMLYSRLNDAGRAFEPQRNLMLHSFGLDGGGSVAADHAGNVYVAWHGIGEAEAKTPGKEGEARRSVWLTRSEDDGRSFLPEHKAWTEPTGACGCCGMKIFAGKGGNLLALYRSATASVHRDIYLLTSSDHGRDFHGSLLHRWEINACPMSSVDIAENGSQTAVAWETGGQVYWTRIAGGAQPGKPTAAPGEGKGRKHPRLAINRSGEVLLVWTEGTGWQKGGSFAWQRFDREGEPVGETSRAPGIPAWSFAAPVARLDGAFSILY